MSHDTHILALLKGRTQHHPMQGDDLLARTGLAPEDLNAALDDLQRRAAINCCEITRDGKTHTAIWPTGILPRMTSWMSQRDRSKRLVDTQAAHAAQQAAEQSRRHITHLQEPVMPTPPVDLQTLTRARPGELRNQIINALAGVSPDDCILADDLLDKCPSAGSLGSLRKTVERLDKQGVIGRKVVGVGQHRRAWCWDVARGPWVELGLRQDGVDPPAAAWRAASDAAITASDPVAYSVRFLLCDAGELSIDLGEEVITLDKPDTLRLYNFLEDAANVIAPL